MVGGGSDTTLTIASDAGGWCERKAIWCILGIEMKASFNFAEASAEDPGFSLASTLLYYPKCQKRYKSQYQCLGVEAQKKQTAR